MGASAALFAPYPCRPGVVRRQAGVERLDLAQRAAEVRVAGEQAWFERLVLLAHRDGGGQGDDVDRKRRVEGVAGAERLDEVVAGVQEQDIDARHDARRQMSQHAVAHRRRDAQAVTEGRRRPLQDLLRGRGLEPDQRPVPPGRAARMWVVPWSGMRGSGWCRCSCVPRGLRTRGPPGLGIETCRVATRPTETGGRGQADIHIMLRVSPRSTWRRATRNTAVLAAVVMARS